ncbi:ribosome recycling factor [Candidatus Microgenomates bacterium]|nr:ribosome recycling factor [Candidatus Microgenomates bacterium]
MIEEIKQKMQKTLQILRDDLGTVRTGKAAPAILENISVSCYGGAQKLKIMELCTISAPDPQTLTLTPFDPSIIGEIRNGIMTSGLGLNPVIDGPLLRISIPPLTEERRLEMVKLVKQKIEGGRIMIRQIRHERMAEIKRGFEGDEISEDERVHQEKELQEVTDKIMEEIEAIGKQKEEELLTI